ncbi:nitroreductase family protein [Vibrio owensii]|uniref:nitroreductase family protein n=1 Tax=Vibrio owensii TaxID=696485 RepID=UPI003390EAD6
MGYIDYLIKERRSVRNFDSEVKVPGKILRECLELAKLAPNSCNMQLWEFHVVSSTDKLEAMRAACLNQKPTQGCSSLVAFVSQPRHWEDSIKANVERLEEIPELYRSKEIDHLINFYQTTVSKNYRNDRFGILGQLRKLEGFVDGFHSPTVREVGLADVRATVHKNNAFAMMAFMLAMKDKGFDTCVMEGIDSKRVKALLGLPNDALITAVVACGKSEDESANECFRFDKEVIFEH